MAERIRYLFRRAIDVSTVMISPMGLVAAGAAVSAWLALAVSGNAAVLFGAISVALWLATILVLGDRVRVVWSERHTSAPAPEAVDVPGSSTPTVAESASIDVRRLESARRTLSQVAPQRIEESDATPSASAPPEPRRPLISIVVPVFNNSRYILSCLQSVRSQTYENWECIVIDDAATDSSLRVVWDYARVDKRIRIVRHTRHEGASSARNTGLRLAQGEFVTFVDPDDFLTQDSLADRILHLMPYVNDPTVAGVYCGVAVAPEDASPNDYATGALWSGSPIDFVTSGDHDPLSVSSVLARTSVLRAAGGFDESMGNGAEGDDLWHRMTRNGFRFEPSGLQSALHRRNPSSANRQDMLESFAEAERLAAVAHESAEEAVAFSQDALPMLRSKGSYEASISLARRAIESAGTRLLAGDEHGAVELLEAIKPVHPAVLSWHIHPENAINNGFCRYLGLAPDELAPLERELAPLAEHAARLVNEHVTTERIEIEVRPSELDVVLIPQTSYQLVQMLDAVGDTDLRVAVVDSSAAAGDQGVADLLRGMSLPSTTVLSYNEAILGSSEAQVVVLSHPWDVAIDELAFQFVAGGASAVVLASDLEDTLRVADAPPSRVPVRDVTRGDLSEACRNNRTSSLTQTAGAEPHPTFDTSLLGYRDAASVWTREEYPDREFDAADMARFADIHGGERVVIIGNGPSLNDLDLSLLQGISTIGVNGIFYADDRLPDRLSYYVVEDTAVVRDNLERVQQYEAGHRFFPSIYREMIGESDNTSFFMMNRGFYEKTSPAFCVPRFSTDPAQRLYTGQSVTTMNLQLAYYMGFVEVILIGMDFSYTVPESSEINGDEITSLGDDPNHFHPDYFGRGKVWKDPKLDRVLSNYALAKQMFEADGRRIINATPGGNLHLFDRVPFEELLGR